MARPSRRVTLPPGSPPLIPFPRAYGALVKLLGYISPLWPAQAVVMYQISGQKPPFGHIGEYMLPFCPKVRGPYPPGRRRRAPATTVGGPLTSNF